MRDEFENSEPYMRLHEVALRYGVYMKVDRSNITRGWTYNANIFHVYKTGKFHHDAPHVERTGYAPMGAGQGVNQTLAVIDAIRISRLTTPDVLVAIMEAELWLLARAVRLDREKQEKRALLELAVDQQADVLTDLIRSYKVLLASPKPIAASPNEDDDL